MSELTGQEIRERIERSNKLTDQLESSGGQLDIGAIYSGARRAEEERAENQRKLRERQAAAQAVKDKELNDLLIKLGEHLHKDTEAKAAREIKEAKAKAEKELAAKIRKQNGLLSAEEEALDQTYISMLKNLNKNK